MKRTQIYIEDDIFSILENESKTARRSISDLIRESIREKYLTDNKITLKRINSVYGIWKNRKIDVDSYIRDMRKDRQV